MLLHYCCCCLAGWATTVLYCTRTRTRTQVLYCTVLYCTALKRLGCCRRATRFQFQWLSEPGRNRTTVCMSESYHFFSRQGSWVGPLGPWSHVGCADSSSAQMSRSGEGILNTIIGVSFHQPSTTCMSCASLPYHPTTRSDLTCLTVLGKGASFWPRSPHPTRPSLELTCPCPFRLLALIVFVPDRSPLVGRQASRAACRSYSSLL